MKITKQDIELIVNTEFEVINSTDLVLTLIRVYSVLYLNGKSSYICSKCLRNYHNELIKNGLVKFEKMKLMESTNEIIDKKKNSLMYVPEAGHYNLGALNDKQAIELLESGRLKESDFKKLPTGFNKEKTAPIKKKRGRKKNNAQ